MALASAALATARTLLNDDAASTWSDGILLPKLQEAHRELQCELWIRGSPVVREVTAALLVSIGATDLGASQPADLLAPFKLIESPSGTGSWEDMTECIYLPTDAPATKLLYWCWSKEKITFIGSTANRYVKVYYRKLITVPVTVSGDIGIVFGELYLGARTAALAAGSVGNKEVLDYATTMAEKNFSKVLMANRGQQAPTNRP